MSDETQGNGNSGHDENVIRLPEVEASIPDAEELFKAGLFLLKRDKTRDALTAFRAAYLQKENEPRYMSYTGVCLALAEGKTRDGVKLCEAAVGKEFYRAELFLNLGRVYLLAGNRKKAHQAFRKGMALDKESRDLRSELERAAWRAGFRFAAVDLGGIQSGSLSKALNEVSA